jgi:hypothetical protein
MKSLKPSEGDTSLPRKAVEAKTRKLVPIKQLVNIPEEPTGEPILVSASMMQKIHLSGLPAGTLLSVSHSRGQLFIKASAKRLTAWIRLTLCSEDTCASIPIFAAALEETGAAMELEGIPVMCVPGIADAPKHCYIGCFFTRGSSGTEIMDIFDEWMDIPILRAKRLLQQTALAVTAVPGNINGVK